MEEIKLKVLITSIALVLGFTSCRLGQRHIVASYEACMDNKLQSIKSLEDLLSAKEACMPSAAVLKIFFW